MATYTGLSIRISAVVNESGTGTDASIYTVPAGKFGVFSGAVANGDSGYFRIDGSQTAVDGTGNGRGMFIAADGGVISFTGTGAWDLHGVVFENNG